MGISGSDATQKDSNEKLAGIAHIFHLFGTDSKKNIDIILEQTCSILDGTCSLYHRIDDAQKSLVMWAGHNCPNGLEKSFNKKGLICWEATMKRENKPVIFPDLESTPFFTTDPYVKKFKLKSYLGFPITLKNKVIGSLCIVDTKTRAFTPDEINCIQTLAAALSLEEERLAREHEMQVIQNRFKGFYDATFESIFFSEKGICTDQNMTAGHMFGYSLEEALGNPGTDWIIPEDRDLVMNNMLSGVTKPYEVTALRKDGSAFPAEIQARMIDIDNTKIRVTALRDISVLKKAQVELLEEKERYRLLVENANDAICILQDGLLKFANPKTTELSGYAWEELNKIHFFDLVHPDDKETVKKIFIRRIKGENLQPTNSFRVLNKKQDTLWVQSNAVKIIWEGAPAILGCFRDISHVKELEEKLMRAEKMELIGTMAGGVAHDLNNILSGLVSYPELLLMQLPKDSPLKEPISFMHDAGLRAADIVQDLLTLTRRGLSIQSVINLNTVIHEYFTSSAHRRLEKTYPLIQFNIETQNDLLNICGSPSHISKVIMNLVINAAEAIGRKGVVIIETFNRYIDIPLSGQDDLREGDYVGLKVTDTGAGIPKEDLNKIFEPFYTRKQMGRSGSGLGLSVVWNCVKDHNGHIEVKSKKNKGSVFELYFPATRKNTEKGPDIFHIDDFKGNGETVLVIDDVDEQRKIAQDSLKMLGYTPFAVASGEKAVQFLKKQPIALIILDMKMEPGMDGLETYKQILSINPSQKAIIASGFSESERVKETLKIGAGQYIKKPYTIKNLAHALKKELAS